MVGVVVLLVALALTVGVGLWRRAADGRFREHRPPPAARAATSTATSAPTSAATATSTTAPERTGTEPDDDPRPEPALDAGAWRALGAQPGERATLLQFSSAFCAPCRATRVVLADVARVVPGVAHVEVDAEQHLDLVRRLGVMRTPTTLVLDAAGLEATRAAGAPERARVLAALSQVVDVRSEE